MKPEPESRHEPAASLRRGLEALLAEAGRDRELGANATLSLDRADAVWLIRQGTVELFAVPVGGRGRRRNLLTLGAGELLLGQPPPTDDGAALGLLATGHPGTRVTELPVARLEPLLAADAEERLAFADLLDRWLGHLAQAGGGSPLPRDFEELEPGGEPVLAEPGQTARPREGIVWVDQVEGSSHLLGVEELAIDGAATLPLAPETWLVGRGGTRLAVSDTRARLARPRPWQDGLGEGIERFHRALLRHVALEAGREAERERGRLDRQAELDRRTLEGAHSQLASVLEVEAPLEAEAAEVSEPLVAACRVVGATQGIEIRWRSEWGAGSDESDLLSRLCAVSRVRSRRVILRDDWWCHDNGPLVAFRNSVEEGGPKRPVALLPTSPTSYELLDPGTGIRTPVDRGLSDSLAGDAYMLYPALPERPLHAGDLVRLAFRGRRRDLLLLAVIGAAGGLLALLVPILTGQLFTNVIPGADRSQLLEITLALSAAACAGAAFEITRNIAVLRLGGKFDGNLQTAIWDRLLALPVSFFRRFSVGDLANRSLGVDAIRELLTGNAVTSVLGAAASLFSFALLFYYSWRLALVATGLVGVLVVATLLLTYLQVRYQRRVLAVQGEISSLLFGLINGIAKLRISGAEHRGYALWSRRFVEQRHATIRARRISNIQATINEVFRVASSLALFAAMALVSRKILSVGEFLAFNAAFGQFTAATLAMIGVLSSALALVPFYERLSPILETEPEVDATKAEAGELRGEVELSHVSFRYQEDGPLVLDDVSFRADPGEFIALVGPSGAGKSTCLRLLLGFERPETGSLYFDGQDVSALSIRSVRRQIGVVLQNGRPIVGDIYTNIVGGANLGIEAAWEAARLAGLADDIQAMPMGMHTVISEGGGTFSEGQKQRLLIARALVHRPRIILFDEATSALDNQTQEVVRLSLERLKATRIVIAHRLSTILHADRIYVLEAGHVSEMGSYEELRERRGGTFARLVERQVI